jgi:hypothetical protein
MFPPKAWLILVVFAAIGVLWWPLVCEAQMVGPTPQPPGVPISPEEAARVEPETWAVHVQSTLTPMYHPGFTSPFRGTNSLDPHEQARESLDVTLYAGVRPWPGAEFWFNPRSTRDLGSATPPASRDT